MMAITTSNSTSVNPLGALSLFHSNLARRLRNGISIPRAKGQRGEKRLAGLLALIAGWLAGNRFPVIENQFQEGGV